MPKSRGKQAPPEKPATFRFGLVSPRAPSVVEGIENCFQNPWIMLNFSRQAHALMGAPSGGNVMAPDSFLKQLNQALGFTLERIDELSAEFAAGGVADLTHPQRVRAREIARSLREWIVRTALLRPHESREPEAQQPLDVPEFVERQLRELGTLGRTLAMAWADMRATSVAEVAGPISKDAPRKQEGVTARATEANWAPGFGRVTFRGHAIDFDTPQQRAVIATLRKANEATKSEGTPVHESELCEAADGGSGWSMRKTFARHLAYKSILRPAKGRGMWALFFDDEADRILDEKKKEIGQLGGQLGGRRAAKTAAHESHKPHDAKRAGKAPARRSKVDPRRS